MYRSSVVIFSSTNQIWCYGFALPILSFFFLHDCLHIFLAVFSQYFKSMFRCIEMTNIWTIKIYPPYSLFGFVCVYDIAI